MARSILLVLAALVGATRIAAADDMTWGQRSGYPSPQRFVVEAKFGTYSPDIDSTTGLRGTPFSDLFNSQFGDDVGRQPSGKLLSTVEFDWQFFHRFGSLGLAASIGYTRQTTHSFEFQNGSSCLVPSCQRSNDTTALNVFPMTLELVYRFDVLALRYSVPLVPYFKGGFGYYFWFIQKGSGGLATGSTNSNDDDHGIGGTPGLVLHPGLALMLDFIEPQAARTLDSETGINHTYLFVEMNYGWITGLGLNNKMALGDLGWNLGIAFEF